MFVYPPGNDHIPYLRKRKSIDSSSCLLGGDMWVPWRVDTSKLLVCSHRAGGTNAKTYRKSFCCMNLLYARNSLTCTKKHFLRHPSLVYPLYGHPKTLFTFFQNATSSERNGTSSWPCGGSQFPPVEKGHLQPSAGPFLCPSGEKKEDGPRRDPLAKPGGTAGFMLLRSRLRTAKKWRESEKVGSKNLRVFFWSPGAKATRRKNARW